MDRPSSLVMIAVLIGSVVAAGCTTPPEERVDPSLAVDSDQTCPKDVQLRLTNNDPRALEISAEGFRVTDVDGTVGSYDETATQAHSSEAFPTSITVASGESVVGRVAFNSGTDHPPYTVKYEGGGVAAEVVLLEPQPGAPLCDSGFEVVSMSASAWSGDTSAVSIISVSTSKIGVSSLAFQIVASNGTIYFSGSAGTGSPVNGVIVSVTYNDAKNEGKVGSDDDIAISVGSVDQVDQLHGTTFKILKGNNVLGTAALQ